MKFSEIKLQAKYDSLEDNILEEFYVPMFSTATRYDRSVGYFDSKLLARIAEGVERFLKNNGKIRLIIGDPLNKEEFRAVLSGKERKKEELSEKLFDVLKDSENLHLQLLEYLIAVERLEIKFAVTLKGMYHKKVGIFQKGAETVVFSGSANETINGINAFNHEELSVFFSWDITSFNNYGKPEVQFFEDLWRGRKKATVTIELNSQVYKNIAASVNKNTRYDQLIESFFKTKNNTSDSELSDVYSGIKVEEPFYKYKTERSEQEVYQPQPLDKTPKIPEAINGHRVSLFKHQKESIENWKNGMCQGILKLATGSGKTFTAINIIIDLFKALTSKGKHLVTIITVPYIPLAEQWLTELGKFNISPVQAYGNSEIWSKQLAQKQTLLKEGQISFICILAVNKTFSSEKFQRYVEHFNIDDLLFIGDECHRLASDSLCEKLPQCKYRLGLSATPYIDDEDEQELTEPDLRKTRLLNYFSRVSHEYSLDNAIKDGILAPYNYKVIPVYLDSEEQQEYEELTRKIISLGQTLKGSDATLESKSKFSALCRQRSALVGTCRGKIPALQEYLEKEIRSELYHSLFYVGEGIDKDTYEPYIFSVTKALDGKGVKSTKYTSEESSNKRVEIMQNFRSGEIQALVAMKVLDEGIDVPVCKTAFILASTRNPRQYVQRRGRVLRKSNSTSTALIVDFIVLPNKDANSKIGDGLRSAELDRVNDFMSTCANYDEVLTKIKYLGLYND